MTNLSHIILSADMVDYAKGSIRTNVCADDIDDNYDPDQVQFYCSECAKKKHYTRLVPVKAQSRPVSSFDAPRRYRLFDHKDSTHQCTLPTRFHAFELNAHRYNGTRIGPHQYRFLNHLERGQIPSVIAGEIKTIDRASRLAAIAYFLMYDQDLLQDQELSLDGEKRVSSKFRDAFFDASKDDKISLFRHALDAVQMRRSFTMAGLFQPNPFRPVWRDYADQLCVPATNGSIIGDDDLSIRPINLLWCKDKETYKAVREMADRDITRASAPLMVMGDAIISTDKLSQAQKKSAQSGKTETVYTLIKINDPSQVTPWDHDISFEKVADNQNRTQEIRRGRIASINQRKFLF